MELLQLMVFRENSLKAFKVYLFVLYQASLTFNKDGYRRFGDHVMLFNGKV
jgi:hypothetical protein